MPDVILDKAKQSLAAFIRGVMNRIDYYAMYPCAVVAQNADGSLEMKPDDPRLPQAFTHVPLRLGIPGTTVTLSTPTRALIGFYAGDPTKPFAALFELSTVTKISIVGLEVDIGSSSPVDFMLKGTAYRTAQATLDTAWNTYNGVIAAAFAAINTATTIPQINAAAAPVAAAATTFATALVTTFETAAQAALSAIAKVG